VYETPPAKSNISPPSGTFSINGLMPATASQPIIIYSAVEVFLKRPTNKSSNIMPANARAQMETKKAHPNLPPIETIKNGVYVPAINT